MDHRIARGFAVVRRGGRKWEKAKAKAKRPKQMGQSFLFLSRAVDHSVKEEAGIKWNGMEFRPKDNFKLNVRTE